MARDFVAASSQKMKIASAVVSATPWSAVCWLKPVADGVLYTMLSIDDNSAQGWSLGWNGGANSARIHINGTLTVAQGISTGGGVWYHVGWLLRSTTHRNVYFNGTLMSANTTSLVPSSVTQTQIGARNAGATFMNGTLAEMAVWNVELDDAEFKALYSGGSGISPLLVRPQSLVAYWPLMGFASPEIDLRGRNELTLTGTPSQVAHPRIIYPPMEQQMKRTFVAPATGGGKLIRGGALINSSLIRGGRLVA